MRTKLLILAAAALLIAPAINAADPTVFPLNQGTLPMQGLSGQAVDVDVMTAELHPMADPVIAEGAVLRQAWLDDDLIENQMFRADAVLQVPNKVPGFETIADAMDADLRLRFSHHGYVYAECRLVVEPVVSRSFVYFTIETHTYGDEVKILKGACDINMVDPGLQVGVPMMQEGVMVKAVVVGKPFDEFEFMLGYCE